jgi:hypothetical protein
MDLALAGVPRAVGAPSSACTTVSKRQSPMSQP